MISFKEFTKHIQEQTLIMEAKLDDLKSKYSGKLNTSHDPRLHHSISNNENKMKRMHDNIIDVIHHADPHPKKSYTEWAVKRYSAGDFKREDTPSLTDTLKNFEKFKSALPTDQRDINKHTLSSLRTVLQPHIEKGSKSSRKDDIVTKGAELLHDKNGVKVYHAKTREASCALGAGTPWCTAHQDPKSNMFDRYTKGGAKHYIIKLENEKYPHRKLGIIHEYDEFQDENNVNIKHNGKLQELVQRNPELKNVDILQGIHISTTKDIDKHKMTLAENDPNGILPHLKDSDYDKIFSSKKHSTIKEIIMNRKPEVVTDKHIDILSKDKNSFVKRKLLERFGNKFTDKHISNIIKDNDLETLHSVAGNKNLSLSPEHIETLLKHSEKFKGRNYAKNEYEVFRTEITKTHIKDHPNKEWVSQIRKKHPDIDYQLKNQ